MSEFPDKQELIGLLQQWQAGDIDVQAVHEAAEQLYERYGEEDEESLTGPGLLGYQVVCILEVLPVYLVIPDDVPYMLDFLNAASADMDVALEHWDDYWNELDYNARREILKAHPYYSRWIEAQPK